jgi:hypothetical protein
VIISTYITHNFPRPESRISLSDSRIFPESTKSSLLKQTTTEKAPGVPKEDKPSKQLVEGQSLGKLLL